MLRIFSDFEVVMTRKDWASPGIFLKALKPRNFEQIDLSNVELFSMVWENEHLSCLMRIMSLLQEGID